MTSAKLQNERLRKAVRLLDEISEDWNEEQVGTYPKELASFDEVVLALSCIYFEDKNNCNLGADSNDCGNCSYYPDYEYNKKSGECMIKED